MNAVLPTKSAYRPFSRRSARGQIIGLREGMLKMLFSIETQKAAGRAYYR